MSHQFILASNSPRRRDLLTEAGYEFLQSAKLVDESFDLKMDKKEVAEHLAIHKNAFHRDIYPNDVILTADTMVLLEDLFLEKPASTVEAIEMLELLSGKLHRVITGVCISNEAVMHSFSVITEVLFADVTRKEISYYIDNYQPFDKAGGYGIQEWIGLVGIKQITGSYPNVVGLPLHEVFMCLKENFRIIPR